MVNLRPGRHRRAQGSTTTALEWSSVGSHPTTAVSDLAAAYRYCQRVCQSHYENFSVVSWLVPRPQRYHFYSIYAFCRLVDDLGDEAAGDRLALLDQWEADLRRCYGGRPRHPIHIALQHTIQELALPDTPFLKLIEANRMDQRQHRYPTYADLLRYCEHSANPVGHLVLHLFGYSDAHRQRLSDAICTALQLANFWQDVARDWQAGRLYIPQEDMARFGYSETDLAAGLVNDSFRTLMAFQVARTRGLFQEGAELLRLVKGAARFQIRLYRWGGLAVLAAIERQGYDVLHQRPTLSKVTKARLAAQALVALASERLRLAS